jgi:hypothetical protein
MTSGAPTPPDPNETISRHAHLLVGLWVSVILLFYAAAATFGVKQMQRYKAQTQQFRNAWISSIETAHPASAIPPSPTATPVAVSVMVNRAGNFSLREGTWETDFDIAFRWKGNAVDAGKTFRIANGEMIRREKEVSAILKNGERFERYNVRARMEQPFDPTRFPFSDSGLIVQIEDASHDTGALRYQVYGSGIRVSPYAFSPGLKITRTYAGVKRYSYGQNGRDPSIGREETHSRFVFAMLAKPRGTEIYIKMFQALFASVAIALLVFFIKPTYIDPRFGLGVGAFFAAIGNNIFLVTLLPAADRVTLTDMVNLVGLVTIFLTLVQSTISLHLCDTGKWRLSRYFDRLCFSIFVLGFLTVNLLLPFAAKS